MMKEKLLKIGKRDGIEAKKKDFFYNLFSKLGTFRLEYR